MINTRLVSICEILLKENKYVTVESISKNLNFCNKTIRNDLTIIEKWINEFDLTLDKKTGVGVAIQGDEKLKLSVLNDIIERVNVVESFSPEDRRIYILEQLFTCEYNIRIRELSQTLYVSRATIHKDLIFVSNWLNKYKIKLIRKTNRGLQIEGKERYYRKAIYSLIYLNKTYSQVKKLVVCEHSEIDTKSLKTLKRLIDIDFKMLENIVLSLNSFIQYNLSDESLLSLLIHLSITIKRISSGKNVIISDSFLTQLKSLKEFIISEELCRKLEDFYNIKFSDHEIGYLLVHIFACRKCSTKKINVKINNSIESNNIEVSSICNELIAFWGNSLNICLSNDYKLRNSLMSHLQPTITRIKYGLTLNNPLLNDIKTLYPKTYTIVKNSSYIFSKFLSCNVDENEIGYLTLHLANAIDRIKQPLKTIVICHCGIGASNLLATKLKQEFNLIELKNMKSSTFITEEDLKDIDLIISTIPLDLNRKVIIVPPLLRKQDILRLNLIIKNLYVEKNSLSLKCGL